MIPGSEEHLRFVTLTAAMDYQRDADHLWSAARRTYADPDTRYLFDPVRAATTAPLKVVANLQRYHLSRRREVDAQTWQRICINLTHRFEGEVRVLIDFARRDAIRLLALIRSHSAGFPYLKGAKLGPRWVHMQTGPWQGTMAELRVAVQQVWLQIDGQSNNDESKCRITPR